MGDSGGQSLISIGASVLFIKGNVNNHENGVHASRNIPNYRFLRREIAAVWRREFLRK